MIIRLECELNGAVEEMDVNDSMSIAELKMLACVQFLGEADESKYELVFQNRVIGEGDMAGTTLLQNNIPNNCVIKLRNKRVASSPSPVIKRTKKSSNQDDILSSAMGSFLQQSSTPNSSSSTSKPSLSFDFGAIKVQNTSNTKTADTPPTSNQKIELTDAEKAEHTGLFNMLSTNKAFKAQMEQNMPGAVRAVEKNSMPEFLEYFRTVKAQRMEQRKKMFNVMMNPESKEAKEYSARTKKLQNIEENFRFAMEHHPEAFGSVFMLYINCKVNGKAIKAFVDSGAQMSIMSADMAESCDLHGLIDERFAGMAVGVGTQKILGKVHYCQLEINGQHFHNSFSILEGQKMDIILGLDFLKRHQASIDLKKNALVLPACNTEARFLNENELPSSSKMEMPEEMDTGNGEKSSSVQENSGVFKEKLSKLLEMGIDENKAKAALEQTGGDVDSAMAILFQ
jgi:DNA damage-inducible protein 1